MKFVNNIVVSVAVFCISIHSLVRSVDGKKVDQRRCPFLISTKDGAGNSRGLELFDSKEMKKEKNPLIMCVLNQRNGNVIFAQEFPIYEIYGVRLDLKRHMENVAPERIVILACDGDSVLGIRNVTRLISSLGSTMIHYLELDYSWIWAFVNGGKTLFENLRTRIYNKDVFDYRDHVMFSWSDIPVFHVDNDLKERWEFCSKYGALGDLCDEALPISLDSRAFENNNTNTVLNSVPVIITAGKRASYLYQSIKSYLKAPGAIKSNFRVLLGSKSKQNIELLQLFNISYKYIPPSQYGNKDFFPFYYYREVFQFVVNNFNNSLYAIFLEEDVEVAPDFFSFMNQTIPLLNKDPSLYCISGYSSTGLKNLAYDESMLLRGDTPVGWGYSLSMNFIKEALEAWPINITERRMVYDGWIYLNLKGKRECVFPEVSRVRHFGVGLNTIFWLSEIVYFTMPLAKSNYVYLPHVNNMKLSIWREQLRDKLKNSDSSKENICNDNYISRNTEKSYLMCYNYTINDEQSGLANFAFLGNCFNTWVYSFQGQHNYVSIIKISPKTTYFLVANPISPYSDLCPKDQPPFDIRNLNSQEKAIYERKNNLYAENINLYEQPKYEYSDIIENLFIHL